MSFDVTASFARGSRISDGLVELLGGFIRTDLPWLRKLEVLRASIAHMGLVIVSKRILDLCDGAGRIARDEMFASA